MQAIQKVQAHAPLKRMSCQANKLLTKQTARQTHCWAN